MCLRHTVEKVVGEAEAKLKELAHPDPYTSEQRTHAPRPCRERDPPPPSPRLTHPLSVWPLTPLTCVCPSPSLLQCRTCLEAPSTCDTPSTPLASRRRCDGRSSPTTLVAPHALPLAPCSHTYGVACRLSDPAHTELLQVSHRPRVQATAACACLEYGAGRRECAEAGRVAVC